MAYNELQVMENVPLAPYVTMRLGGVARYFIKINDKTDVTKAVEFAGQHSVPIFVLGGGSNVLVRDEGFAGLVIKNEIKGIQEIQKTENESEFIIGAGENWNDFVHWAVDNGFVGLEAMTLIPGTVGALPVQNVGAYGQEVADFFISLEAYNFETGEFETLNKVDCKFSYRNSIFRTEATGKYLITSVKIKLTKAKPSGELYPAVKKYFERREIDTNSVSAKQIMQAVEVIRGDKLPDPVKIPSAGSFFKNAIISATKADEIKNEYGEDIPLFTLSDNEYKLSTGWLIEKTGLKGEMIHGMRVHPENALVLTNINAKGFSDLIAAREEIIRAVNNKFGIIIEQEPLEM